MATASLPPILMDIASTKFKGIFFFEFLLYPKQWDLTDK